MADKPVNPTRHRPIRVLHVVAAMDRGGIENWLVGVMRRTDPARVRHQVLVQTHEPGDHDAALAELDIPVHRCPDPHRPWRYARRFRQILREHGPFDIVHGHPFTWSGFVLRLAAKEGVSVRIAHSHNTRSRAPGLPPWARPAYAWLMRRWVRRYATHGLAASEPAARALFGPRWADEADRSVLHCGIDLDPFTEPVDRDAVRAELQLAPGALVIGNVARLVPQKNQRFIVQILAALRGRGVPAHFVAVGGGPCHEALESQARDLGVLSHCSFLGERSDVARVLRAMDAFVLPSLFEGLGLAAVEAQAAGVPVFLADHLPAEVIVVEGLVHRLALSAGAERWADAIISLGRDAGGAGGAGDALRTVGNSSFNITRSAAMLCDHYEAMMTTGAGGGTMAILKHRCAAVSRKVLPRLGDRLSNVAACLLARWTRRHGTTLFRVDGLADGISLCVNPDAHIGGLIYWRGYYEMSGITLLRRILAPDMTLIDVGANIGEYTLHGCRLVPRGRVVSFEPSWVHAVLEQNLAINDCHNVEAFKMGLSDRPGRMRLYSPPPGDSDSFNEGLSSFFHRGGRGESGAWVEVETLDRMADRLQLQRVGVVKIDVEGSELFVLRGARGVLNRFKPKLLLELNPATSRAAGYGIGDVLDLLAEHGYRVRVIGTGGRLIEVDPRRLDRQCDVLCD